MSFSILLYLKDDYITRKYIWLKMNIFDRKWWNVRCPFFIWPKVHWSYRLPEAVESWSPGKLWRSAGLSSIQFKFDISNQFKFGRGCNTTFGGLSPPRIGRQNRSLSRRGSVILTEGEPILVFFLSLLRKNTIGGPMKYIAHLAFSLLI